MNAYQTLCVLCDAISGILSTVESFSDGKTTDEVHEGFGLTSEQHLAISNQAGVIRALCGSLPEKAQEDDLKELVSEFYPHLHISDDVIKMDAFMSKCYRMHTWIYSKYHEVRDIKDQYFK